MDMDHLLKLVRTAYEEAEDLNTEGPAFDELVLYLDEIGPYVSSLARRLNKPVQVSPKSAK